MKKKSKIVNMPIVIEKDKNGFFAYCPSLQGCYTQGNNYEEIIKNIREVVELCLEDEKKSQNFVIPSNVSLTSIEVRV